MTNELNNAETGDMSNPYYRPGTYKFLAILILILCCIGYLGFVTEVTNRLGNWQITLFLFTAFVVVVGRSITGSWRGILIDSRNKISLSRLQMTAWTIIILSAVLIAATSNVNLESPQATKNGEAELSESGWRSPVDFEIPSQLWVLMGISTMSLVVAPTLLASKANREPDQRAVEQMRLAMPNQVRKGMITTNHQKCQARWADLLMGEEITNCDHLDFGKLQMFLFSFLTMLVYCVALASMFGETGIISQFPDVSSGMSVLLAISNTGYLANKILPHTAENATPATG